jgi:hypothetical protein
MAISFKPISFTLEKDSESLIIQAEKYFIGVKKESDDEKEIYANFEQQILTYLDKVHAPYVDVVRNCVKRDILFIMRNTSKNNNTLSARYIHNDKLMAIGLECTLLDIDPLSGLISNVEETIMAIYYSYISSTCTIFNSEIIKNFSLHEKVINYYTFMLIKALKVPPLVEKKVELIKFIVGIMYYKFFVKLDFNLAKEKALRVVSNQFQAEFDDFKDIKLLDKYTTIKDITKALVDLKVLFTNTNELMYNWVSSLKTISLLSVTDNFEFLIAGIIASQYSTDILKPLLLNRSLQQQVELSIQPFYDRVGFDSIRSYNITHVKRAE